MLKYLVSAATATGDTTKTLVETLQLPAGSKRIVGTWAHALAGAGLTTLENVTGILELESPDVNLQPCQIPLEPVAVLTGGTPASQIHVWPMDVPVGGGERISGYITMDMAQTVAGKARFGLVIEI